MTTPDHTLTDDAGMPVHFPIGLTEDGQGPEEPNPHHRGCWCGDPGCHWTTALAAEREAGRDEMVAAVEALADEWQARTSDGMGVRREHWRGRDFVEGEDHGLETAADDLRAVLAGLPVNASDVADRLDAALGGGE